MRQPTEMQLKFAENYAHGLGKKEAAVAAGYSPAHADVTAAKLMKNDGVKAHIKKLRKIMAKPGAKADPDAPADRALQEAIERNKMPADENGGYDDPKQFYMDLMNHKGVPVAVRASAAKELLPYMHARIGEKGKKESQNDLAKKVAGGGGEKTRTNGKTRLAPKDPPRLRLVGED